MPAPEKMLRTLKKAADACRQTPGRQGRFIQINAAPDLLVAGDLHGDIDNFKRVLDLGNLAHHLHRHLVVQELIHGPYRYANGGDPSHRLLDLFAALKCQFPDRVHMLMGNHELSQWTRRAIMKDDEDLNQLFRLGVEAAYGEWADQIYCAYDDLFAVLPVAIRTPNRVFLSHSLPVAKRLDDWNLALITKEEYEDSDFKLGGGIHALVWGRDTALSTADQFLQKVDADWLITGHIVCDDGYAIPNDRQIILDSHHEKPCACLFPADKPVQWENLKKCIVRLT